MLMVMVKKSATARAPWEVAGRIPPTHGGLQDAVVKVRPMWKSGNATVFVHDIVRYP